MPPIGFVILVNPLNRLEQTERLIRTLNRMFGDPPIACHFDFSQNQQRIANLTQNVQVVEDSVPTKWGDFSCIDGAVKALRLLYGKGPRPDWFVYLSGADYPIERAEKILSDLENSSYDGHIEHLLIRRNAPDTPINPYHPEGYKGGDWLRHCHKLNCSRRVRLPWRTRKLEPTFKTFWLESNIFTMGHLPFSKNFRCYGGEAWFCANYKSALSILKFYDCDISLSRHYRKVLVPEETYFHTVLANQPSLRLSQEHFRYIDWSQGGSSPKLIEMEDLPKLKMSSAHFSRKFSDQHSSDLLDIIDEEFLGVAAG